MLDGPHGVPVSEQIFPLGDYPYIAINDLPKVSELKRLFPDLYRNDPVLLKVSG